MDFLKTGAVDVYTVFIFPADSIKTTPLFILSIDIRGKGRSGCTIIVSEEKLT